MKTQIKQQWLSALRSGQYTQTRWNLQTEQGFCCLGVLCDLYSKETGTEWKVNITEDDETFTYYKMKNQTSVLPDCVKEWAGLTEANPSIKLPEEDEESSLTFLNDEGSSFEEIAQLIEEKF
jgi:hypothetical protein